MKSLLPAALALFRLHAERHGDIVVDDPNRETYRELARRVYARCEHLCWRAGIGLPRQQRGVCAEGRAVGWREGGGVAHRALARFKRLACGVIGSCVFAAAFTGAACEPPWRISSYSCAIVASIRSRIRASGQIRPLFRPFNRSGSVVEAICAVWYPGLLSGVRRYQPGSRRTYRRR